MKYPKTLYVREHAHFRIRGRRLRVRQAREFAATDEAEHIVQGDKKKRVAVYRFHRFAVVTIKASVR